jgi:hypothetical protein
MFELTAAEIGGIVAVVVGFTELIKLSKFVPDKFGLGIAAILSALGILAYAASKPELVFARTMLWPFVSAYLIVITSAAGVYGVVRESRGGDVTNASRTGFDGQRAGLDDTTGSNSAQREQSRNPKLPMWLIAVLSASMFFTGCAKANPNMSPERSVALYGIQAGKVLKEVKTSADELHAKQILPESGYRQVLTGLVKANEAGERLGAALKAYDAAITDADRNSLVSQIDAALVSLQAALPGVVPEGLPFEVASRLSKGVVEVQRLMLTIARFTAPRGVWLRSLGAAYAFTD